MNHRCLVCFSFTILPNCSISFSPEVNKTNRSPLSFCKKAIGVLETRVL